MNFFEIDILNVRIDGVTVNADAYTFRAKWVGWGGKEMSVEDNSQEMSGGERRNFVKVSREASEYSEMSTPKWRIRSPAFTGQVHDIANSFLRIEVVEAGKETSERIVLASASLDVCYALVLPKKHLGRIFCISMTDRKRKINAKKAEVGGLSQYEVDVALRAPQELLKLLNRSRMFELQAAVCDGVPTGRGEDTSTWDFELYFPRLKSIAGHEIRVVGASVSNDEHGDNSRLVWQPRLYPHDVCSFGSVTPNPDTPPCYRSFVSDQAAISLRRHFKKGTWVCFVNARSSNTCERLGTISLNVSSLMRPGVSTASCAGELEILIPREKRNSIDDEQISPIPIFVSFRFSHPLLRSGFLLDNGRKKGNNGSCSCYSFEETWTVPHVLNERPGRRPSMIRLKDVSNAFTSSVRRAVNSVSLFAAKEYADITKKTRPSLGTNALIQRLKSQDTYETLTFKVRCPLARYSYVALGYDEQKDIIAKELCRSTYSMMSECRGVAEEERTTKGAVCSTQSLCSRTIHVHAFEAELHGDFIFAESLHRRGVMMTNTDDVATSWEVYGSYKCRRGLLDDALACYDEALAHERSSPSTRICKSAVLYELGKFERALRALDDVDIDEDGLDGLTNAEGVIANALIGLCYAELGYPKRRFHADKASAHRFVMIGNALMRKRQEKSRDEEVESRHQAADIRRLLPRTAILFGATVPEANDHVDESDLKRARAYVVKWLQGQRLVNASERAMRWYDMEDGADVHADLLQARQCYLRGALSRAESCVLKTMDRIQESDTLMRTASLTLAAILRRSSERSFEEASVLTVALTDAPLSNHVDPLAFNDDEDVSFATGHFFSARFCALYRLGNLKLNNCSSKSKDDLDEARSILSRVLDRESSLLRCRLTLAQCEILLGEMEAADVSLRCISRGDIRSPVLYGTMALLALNQDPPRRKVASRFLEMALRRNFRDIRLARWLISSLKNVGNMESKIGMLQAVLESNDNRRNLAWASSI